MIPRPRISWRGLPRRWIDAARGNLLAACFGFQHGKHVSPARVHAGGVGEQIGENALVAGERGPLVQETTVVAAIADVLEQAIAVRNLAQDGRPERLARLHVPKLDRLPHASIGKTPAIDRECDAEIGHLTLGHTRCSSVARSQQL